MRICFLGSGSAIPSAGKGFTSFLVEEGGALVLVDAGDNAYRSILEAGRDPDALDALVLTHAHADHVGGLPAFVAALDCARRGKPLALVAFPAMAEMAGSLLGVFGIAPGRLSFELGFVQAWGSGGLGVGLLEGAHNVPTSMPLFAARGERLLYSSDTRYLPGRLAACAGSCQTLIHEATYPHDKLPPITGHSSALQAGLAAGEVGAESLFLCHFQEDAFLPDRDPAREAAGAFGGAVLVPELLRWYETR